MQLLECTSARAVLSPEEELVLLIAAICHDLDHDGYTNSFHIYSQSPLAQQYNDKSGKLGTLLSYSVAATVAL
jgi:hypothetical protein